jgi:hypothetical protein
VWPVSFVNSTLQTSISGWANVAPLPLIWPANAGEDDRTNPDMAITVTAKFLFNFIYPP